ncbi:MAG: hypothetical protein HY290_21530 [Planctomycetia bacterium]|nr:hypothetical protein [Planctomycetia bacterium]
MTSMLLGLALAFFPPADAKEPAAESKAEAKESEQDKAQDRAEAAEAAEFARDEAGHWQLTTNGENRKKLDLHSKPVLRWSNPAVGRVYGSVFVWTSGGRPVAAASFYRFYVPYVQRTAEFVALAPEGLSAEREGRKLWTPSAGQVKFQKLDDAPAPAASANQRLVQMRRLAREFAPELVDRRVVNEGTQQQLRLMDQPVYQYGAGADGLLDGGLFAFVVGTDPEVLLLLECRESAEGRSWHYALARMNRDAMRVRFRDREVWSVPYLETPWDDPKSDYFIVEVGKLDQKAAAP